MTNEKIIAILAAHSVASRSAGGLLWAEAVIAHHDSQWVNVTGWTSGRLLMWLGY